MDPAMRPEWWAWKSMKGRCLNPNHPCFRAYGGRGIVVCERWRESFKAFYADMGPRPSPLHTLDRINNDGPYSPENCRWATRKEQARNRRTSLWVELRGQRKHLAEWCELTGISRRCAEKRIKDLGWSAEDAVTRPAQRRA